MVLKTYARIFTTDMAKSLEFLQAFVGVVPDYRFTMEDVGLEIAGIADFCVVAGHPEKLLPVRASQGPLIVDDLNEKGATCGSRATIAKPDAESETGRYFYAVHPDGSEIEYVEWKPELRIGFSALSQYDANVGSLQRNARSSTWDINNTLRRRSRAQINRRIRSSLRPIQAFD